MRDQKTGSYRAVPTWVAFLDNAKDGPPLVPHPVEGDGSKSFVRPAPPLPNHLVEHYWRMRHARPWMTNAEILCWLRDPEV
jgi:hypothetical protein